MAANDRDGRIPHAIAWIARLALFTIVVQLSSLGHWSLGPFHASNTDLASHAVHCHGDASGCGGQYTLVGTLADASLLPLLPPALAFALDDAVSEPAAVAPAAIEAPPRA